MRPVVGVLEPDELSARPGDRHVADLVGPAVLRHDDQLDAIVHRRRLGQQRGELRARAVVDHQDLEVRPGLVDQGSQRGEEALVRLEDRHDDRDGRSRIGDLRRLAGRSDAVEPRPVALSQRDRHEAARREEPVERPQPLVLGGPRASDFRIDEVGLEHPAAVVVELDLRQHLLDVVVPSGGEIGLRLEPVRVVLAARPVPQQPQRLVQVRRLAVVGAGRRPSRHGAGQRGECVEVDQRAAGGRLAADHPAGGREHTVIRQGAARGHQRQQGHGLLRAVAQGHRGDRAGIE